MKRANYILGLLLILLSAPAYTQQYIINEKDRTRPEIDRFVPMMRTSAPLPAYDNLSRPHYNNSYQLMNAVELYPTIVRNGTINLLAYFPVERISIITNSGQQVYAADMGGRMDQITVVPSALSPGVYYMLIYGRNWTETKKFIWKDIRN